MKRSRGSRPKDWRSAFPISRPKEAYPLTAFTRPTIAVIDYAKQHAFRSALARTNNAGNPLNPTSVQLSAVSQILMEAARYPHGLDWENLLSIPDFAAQRPTKPRMPAQPKSPIIEEIPAPKLKEIPPPPGRRSPSHVETFWERIFLGLRKRATDLAAQQADKEYRAAYSQWEKQAARIEGKNAAAKSEYERKKADQSSSEKLKSFERAREHWNQQNELLEAEYVEAVNRWQTAKDQYEATAKNENAKIAELRNRYLAGDREAVQGVIGLILEYSRYPPIFPRNVQIHYKPENRIVVVTFQLPDFHKIAITNGTKTPSQRDKTRLQEEALYAIALRTLYEVATSDQTNAIDSIVFNGWVDFIDGTNGQPRSEYILSVHATKDQIAALNISKVNQTECCRSLKGIAAKRVSVYTPVAPLLIVNKTYNSLVYLMVFV
jgi:restriction system protein